MNAAHQETTNNQHVHYLFEAYFYSIESLYCLVAPCIHNE